MKAKKFDCVEMMHRGVEEVQKQTRGKSKEEEIAFWATRSRKLIQRQRKSKREGNGNRLRRNRGGGAGVFLIL